jgi:hypothetical protein
MVLVEGDRLPDQLSERGAVDLILGPKVDRSTGVPRQSRVEQMVGVREEGALGEGQLDDLLLLSELARGQAQWRQLRRYQDRTASIFRHDEPHRPT